MHPEKHAVFIICEHQLIRQGIALLVNQQPDLEVVGSAENYKEAVPLLRAGAPKAIILFTGADAMETPMTLFRLRAASPRARLLVVANTQSTQLVYRLIKAGASGYVGLSAPAEDIFQAIRSLVAGRSYLPAELVLELARISSPAQSLEMEAREQLSKREEEIMRFIVEGHKRREIADRLGISDKTVDTHCARAMKKMGLHRRADVVEYGRKHGWLSKHRITYEA